MIADSNEIRSLAASLIRPDLIIFPVRHHSPACSWYLLDAFKRFSPSAVLIEGPRSFSSQVQLLASPEAKMPLAIYTYAVHKATNEKPEARRAAYYPFCDYSPELIAIREANKRQISAKFIDLDFAEQSQMEPEECSVPQSLLEEKHYERSKYLQMLAGKMGCRDHEELWEHLFETSVYTKDIETHVKQVAAYCYCSRVDYSEEELTSDGTLARETEMAWHIQMALNERDKTSGPVIAVVGGFHAVALPSLLSKSVKRPSPFKGNISEEASAIIRYSFDRLDRLNGYASGMTSPAWHQMLWDKMEQYEKAKIPLSIRIRQETALSFLFDITLQLREQYKLPIPMPSLSAAYQQILGLVRLRQRSAPLREDVLDAIVSCFVKGDVDADGALILSTAMKIFCGNTTGIVPPGASVPPLVKDFSIRARRQRLKIDSAEYKMSVLEIYRRPDHRITSRIFHSLTYLGVPFAVRKNGPDYVNGIGTDRMQEHWEYSYTAATEAGLVEAAVYGATVPLAVTNKFLSQLNELDSVTNKRDASSASQLLIHACVLGIHDHFLRLIKILRDAIANDAVFESLTNAAGTIGLLIEAREPLEAKDIPELPLLLNAAFEKAIFNGLNSSGVPADNGEMFIKALTRLRELLISSNGQLLDADLYWNMVNKLYEGHEGALIRGASAGLLYNAGKLSDDALSIALNGHLNGNINPQESVYFLRGLLQTAREAAWHEKSLISILNDLISKWDEKSFISLLPDLRLAFADMTPKETDRIADSVAALHGKKTIGGLINYDLSESDLQLHLNLSAAVSDILNKDYLKDWVSS
jgi:hypothetical protein